MDSSKLALLSTFLGEKHRDKLPEAIAAAKTGTAKEMRELKPKEPSKAETALAETKAKTEKEIADLKAALELKSATGTPIEFGFIATDIGAGDALVSSKQALLRLKADFMAAANNEDQRAGDTMLETMSYVFGSMLLSVTEALECDAKDLLDEIRAKRATKASDAAMPATGDLVAA